MGACCVCNQETNDTAAVYIGKPAFQEATGETKFTYTKQTSCMCHACVQKHISHSFAGILFYVALQLCWLTVAKYGLLTPFGIIGALIGVCGLWRLIVLVGRRLHQRFRSEKPIPRFLYREEDEASEASDLYKSIIIKREQAEGRRVLSLREYQRTHKV